MEKRLELEKRGKHPSEIKELNLDNARSPTIVGLTDEFTNLETLSLINVGLTSLKGFPKLPKLKRLELSDNRIQNGLNLLHGSPNLSYLNLCGNKITDFEVLKPLKEFKNLQHLDLFNCEVTSIDGYREKVFNLIPTLKYLDGFDQNEAEAKDSDEYSESEINEQDSFDEDEEGGSDAEADTHDEEEEDDDDDDEDDAEEDDDEDDEVGLNELANSDLDEEGEGNDFEPGSDEDELEEDDELDEEEVEASATRGQKRKHEDEEDD